jgi:hypothetical protein
MAAWQTGIDQGQAIRVNQQVRVGDGVGDEVDVRNDFHGSFSLGIAKPCQDFI